MSNKEILDDCWLIKKKKFNSSLKNLEILLRIFLIFNFNLMQNLAIGRK